MENAFDPLVSDQKIYQENDRFEGELSYSPFR